MSWLGWDVRKDADPFGHETGPWELWQVGGLVGSLAVVVAIVARWLGSLVIAGVVAATVTAIEIAMAFVNDVGDPMFGFAIISIPLICLGTAGVTAVITLPARALWHQGSDVSDRSLWW